MKFGALALLAAGVASTSVSGEQTLMKSPSSDVTIDHIAASLDELCSHQGNSACDKTLGELVGAGPFFCDTHCRARAQPHQSFLQNDLEKALDMKQR